MVHCHAAGENQLVTHSLPIHEGLSTTDSVVAIEGDVVISAVGMVSPVGASAAQTFTSVWAGISRDAEAPWLYHCQPQDPLLELPVPVVAAAIGFADRTAYGSQRHATWLAHLATLAYADLAKNSGLERSAYGASGLFLALPFARPDFDPATEVEPFVRDFHNQAGLDLPAQITVFSSGNHGVVELCKDACAALTAGAIEYALVAGIDSHLSSPWLGHLDGLYRLKSDRNIDGFRPGEGAVLLLLERSRHAFARSTAAHIQLVALARGRAVHDGFGTAGADTMPHVIRSVLTHRRDNHDGLVILCDLNGESARASEWGLVVSRLGGELGEAVLMEPPASSYGDLGAATGGALLGLAGGYLGKKYESRHQALVCTSGDHGERAAALVYVADGDVSSSATTREENLCRLPS